MKKLFTLFIPMLLLLTTAHAQNDGDPCPGDTIVIDQRDGNTYFTTRIGNQCWLTENARYLPIVYPVMENFMAHPAYYVFGYFGNQLPQALVDSNYRNYGALYNWIGAHDACPEGWHLPSVEDVEQLLDHLWQQHGLSNEMDCQDCVSAALRSCRQVNSPLGPLCNTLLHPRWDQSDHPGTDDFGFSALPGGLKQVDLDVALGEQSYWWLSDGIFSLNQINSFYSAFSQNNFYYGYGKANGLSVRCLKNIDPSSPYNKLILKANPQQAGLISGAGSYPQGRQVMIQAKPYDGYVFIRWMRRQEVVSYSPWLLYTMPAEEVTLIAEYEPVGQVYDGQPCPGLEVITDARDGNTYNTVVIGSQCWLKENSWFWRQEDASTGYSYTQPFNTYQEFNPDYKEAYGVLYNWPAAIHACPDGWKLPSRYQWDQLFDYLINTYPEINEQNISTYLKDCRQVNSLLGGECNTNEHPRWDYWESFSGTNNFGFSALPGGYWSVTFIPNNFGGLGTSASFWTSSQMFDSESYKISLTAFHGPVFKFWNANAKASAVRCVREGNYLSAPTSIEPEPRAQILIYPNPATSLLWLEFTSDGPAVISLFDPRGILVRQFTTRQSPNVKSSLNLTGLPFGIYLIHIQSLNLNVMQKVIKLGN